MTAAAPRPVQECPDCTIPGGYCAPLRCYCGHPRCPAFHSYIPPRTTPRKDPAQ